MDQRLILKFLMLLNVSISAELFSVISNCQSDSIYNTRRKMLQQSKQNWQRTRTKFKRKSSPVSSTRLTSGIKKNSSGKNTISSQVSKDQWWFTELSWVQLNDLLLFWLNIWLVNGPSGCLQDRSLLFQFRTNQKTTAKLCSSICTTKVSTPPSTPPKDQSTRKSETLS